ncbi:alpha/beta fold hydrolase [Lysinimonas soli]|uniref:Alpha/beta fold hydrolase n=1 Tax=Lysinimonas soli TaxID=1074233 RepID=A0ABW0NVC6_9MICO
MHLLTDGDPTADSTLLLAHGAGAAMDSRGMNEITAALVARGIRVVRFEFGYMAGRRDGVRRPPPRAETLAPEYRDAVDAVRELGVPRSLLIGGKSMGGRVASMIADELADEGMIDGLLCWGYPFHPPEKPGQLRTAHLLTLRVPTLICQGTRDPFGGRDEVVGYGLSPAIDVLWLEDGDHDLRPRAAVSGRSYAQNMAEAADAVAAFAARVS